MVPTGGVFVCIKVCPGFRALCRERAVTTALSNHKLATRRLRALVPRALRSCTLYGLGSIQDECHMFLLCPHLASARLQYTLVFGQHLGMKAMFTRPNHRPIPCFICASLCPITADGMQ
jgi:hypothetical protein